MLEGWHYVLVLFCCVAYGFNTHISRWASQRISWYKIASLRYLIRGLIAAIGVILLLTPMKDNFKDPDISVAKAAGADTWSIPAIIALLIGVFLVVTGAGYSVTYLMQRTPTPTVLSATLSVGGILMALAVGGILFKESLSHAQYVGIALSVIALPLLVVKPPQTG